MDQAFQTAIPLMGQIQLDIGTLLSALIFLGFIIVGFDYVKAMMASRSERQYLTQMDARSSRYEEEAYSIWDERDKHQKGSFEWEQKDQMYKKLLGKSTTIKADNWLK